MKHKSTFNRSYSITFKAVEKLRGCYHILIYVVATELSLCPPRISVCPVLREEGAGKPDLWTEFQYKFGTSCVLEDGYESLNANLRLVLLTRVSKWNSHPKISIVYRGNTFFLLCEQHFEVSINWVSNRWYKRKFQQLWNAMASEQDSDIVFVPNKNIALCMLL